MTVYIIKRKKEKRKPRTNSFTLLQFDITSPLISLIEIRNMMKDISLTTEVRAQIKE